MTIEDRTGEPCRLFAYPYGDAARSARMLVDRHFSGGFTTRLGYASLRGGASALSRVDAYYLGSTRRLRAMLSGRWGMELLMLRAARASRSAIAVARSGLRRYPRPAAMVARR